MHFWGKSRENLKKIKLMQFFSERSTKKELMDDFEVPAGDLDINLRELEFINRFLGGHAVSFAGLMRLGLPRKKELRVLDVGCGGGDTMKALYRFLTRRHYKVTMVGLDANENAIRYAQSRCRDFPAFEWIHCPFQELPDVEADVVHAALFAHHFYGSDLEKLASVLAGGKLGFVLNDLHRHPLAYHSIRMLSQWFSKSYLLRHDAPLSVARGFSREELRALFAPYSGHDIRLEWKWAFRWLLTGKRTSA